MWSQWIFMQRTNSLTFSRKVNPERKAKEDICSAILAPFFWRMSRQVDVYRRKSHRHTSAHMHVSMRNTTMERWKMKKDWRHFSCNYFITKTQQFPLSLISSETHSTTHVTSIFFHEFLLILQIKLELEREVGGKFVKGIKPISQFVRLSFV